MPAVDSQTAGGSSAIAPRLIALPTTKGLSPGQITALMHRPDEVLEATTQPLSPWYLRWKSAMSMAEEYAAMDVEDGSDEDDVMEGEALVRESDCPFPDPIHARRTDMSPSAEGNEGIRVSKVRGKNSRPVDVQQMLEQFAGQTASAGKWAATTISTVVQAHNLRWWVVVEREPMATTYWRALRWLYNHGELRRSAGVRYLLAVASWDDRALDNRRQLDLAEYYPSMAPNRLRYPALDAGDSQVLRYYRNIPTEYWGTGVRTASGQIPARGYTTFSVPNIVDARAAGVMKATLSVPAHGRVGEYKARHVALRMVSIALFSVPGLYAHICTLGGYVVSERRPAAPYPFMEVDCIRLAAWLSEFGVGNEEDVVQFCERWGRLTRERLPRLLDCPGIDVLKDVSSTTDFDASVLRTSVVPREALNWGPVAFDSNVMPVEVKPTANPVVLPTYAAGGLPEEELVDFGTDDEQGDEPMGLA
ncbi:hypothetical protein C2E23DRAFT_739950 [Lenzites betulinus]|nr:hypothetical protein C2E23DRAFT_739950 [Lenzites betulinus]